MVYLLIVTFMLHSGPVKMTYHPDSPEEAARMMFYLSQGESVPPGADLYRCEGSVCTAVDIPALVIVNKK